MQSLEKEEEKPKQSCTKWWNLSKVFSKIHGELILLSAAPRKESQVGLVLKTTSFYFSFLFIDFYIFHTA